MFFNMFGYCTGLEGSIPNGLFNGLSGAPSNLMFWGVFSGCENLTGSIPVNLFGAIDGAPAYKMFQATFSGCKNLTGSIPSGLFGNLDGAPQIDMFSSTFSECNHLSGSIPTGLFGKIVGAPVNFMFNRTFFNCYSLENISGGFENCEFTIGATNSSTSINGTYSGCTGVTSGESPADKNGVKFYDWDSTANSFQTFYNDTGLSDYLTIPANRK